MEDLVAWIVKAAAGAGVLAALAGAIIYMVRGAVATAVQHAANRELAALKAKLDEQLEEKKQAFAAASREAQNDFAKEIERYKSELTLGAETRRQIVSRRMQAIDATYQAGVKVMQDMRMKDLDVGATVDLKNGFFSLVREQSYVLREEFARDVSTIVGDFMNADKLIKMGVGTAEHAQTMNDLHTHLVKRVREELDEMSRSSPTAAVS